MMNSVLKGFNGGGIPNEKEWAQDGALRATTGEREGLR